MNELRQPPHAEGPEKSILSSMMQDPVEYVPRAVEKGLQASDFYLPHLATLYRIFREKFEAGEGIELVALGQELLEKGELERLGGAQSLTEVYTYAPNGAHFDDHLKIVKEKSVLRSGIHFATEVVEMCYDSVPDVSDLLQKIELGALSLGNEADDTSSYDYSFNAALQELFDFLQTEEADGIPTGWKDVDDVTGGLHAGEVTIIGARPGIGKTSSALNICESLACGQKVPTAFFAVEGKRTYLTARLASLISRVSAKRIRDRQLNKGEVGRLKRHLEDAHSSPLRIDDRISTAYEIAAKIRRMHQQSPLKVVVIDYIQKLPPANSDERRDVKAKIQNATDILHQTCKQLDIALVLLAQLNRSSDPYKPTMSDLKDSGSLEQDADNMILIGEVKDKEERSEADPRPVMFRVAKNRHGPTADIEMTFNPPTMKFS